MSRFTEPLTLWPSTDGTAWETTRDLPFEVGCKGSGIVVTVPFGTKTDLASVPRVLWPLVQPHNPRFAAAYVLHDYLCRWRAFDRITADAILKNALLALGASWFYAGMIHLAVSTFRWVHRP